MNTYFSKKDIQMVNRHVKRGSSSPPGKCKSKLQWDITSHPSVWLKSTTQETTSVGEDVEKRKLLHCWWECKLVQSLWKTVWRFLTKVKMNYPTLYNCTTKYLTKDTKILIRRETCTLMFIAALSTTAKLWKEPKCPVTDEWIKKLWYIYMQWNIN